MTDLFTYAEQRPNYRRADPITSKEAGRFADKFRSEHHAAILQALSDGTPLAAEQIADRTSLDTVQTCKRFAELVRAGKIERTPEQHRNRSGRRAFRYRIVTRET
jgi:predicted ArsR family transcriptional regulator